ncbi:hypothetical protein [Desulfofalx alkaliphila]|uniref:hypothetical protein n=1 Tax=Desulfofalx alkaliphila TaxID=105483 RepID=UPI000B2C20B0|nr:hypothetical protein [Desulfofalx alkaliphila]
MPLQSINIDDNKLFELLVAIILRNNGYIAGAPRRWLGGRATKHQVNVIGVDLNNSPFTFNNIIIIKACCKKNTSLDLDMVKNIKATIIDLEHTLPPRRELIRDIAGTDRGDLFHRIYGKNKNRESFTVNYVGGIFISKSLDPFAWEYANANGIYVAYLPQELAGKPLKYWFSRLRKGLSNVVDNNGLITLPSLAKKEKKVEAFKEIIHHLKTESSENLNPEQNHDLFTIINEVLLLQDFTPLRTKLQQLALASMNGYPVVLDYNLTYRNLLEATLVSLSERFRRAKNISQRTKYRPLNTAKFIVTDIKSTLDRNVAYLSFIADRENVPAAIEDMCGALYVPVSVLDRRMTRFQLKLPLKTGISLIGEFDLEHNFKNNKEQISVLTSREKVR